MTVCLRRCVERHTGRLIGEPIYSGAFLPWAYGTRTGRWLTVWLFSRRWISALYGWISKRSWTRRKIVPFVERMGVDVDELIRPLHTFRSFNDFVIREIDLARRPLHPDPSVCVSPADGRLLVFPRVEANTSFRVKHADMNLHSLLRDTDLVREYDGGTMTITRLSLSDYHYFHFPISGVPDAPRPLAGRYFAVTPYTRRSPFSFYAENYRLITRIATDEFGSMLMIEVGAFTIGSIRQCFTPGARVERGARKGYFGLGASIVILLFRQGAISLDADLCTNTVAGLETRIRMGDSIGRAQGPYFGEPIVPVF